MTFKGILRGAVVCLACWGMIAPQSVSVAQERATVRAQLADVALAQGGVLRGRVINSQGKSMAGANVVVGHAGHVIARTTADKDGFYAVKGLRGGVHQVNSSLVRLWSAGTAPKAARQNVLNVSGSIVRGQSCPPGMGGACPPGGPVDMGYMPMDQGYMPVDQGYCPPGAGYAGGGYGGAGMGGAGFAGGGVAPGAMAGGFGPGVGAGAGAAAGGFGLLDVITLATVGTSAAALVYAIDNNDQLDDLERLTASP